MVTLTSLIGRPEGVKPYTRAEAEAAEIPDDAQSILVDDCRFIEYPGGSSLYTVDVSGFDVGVDTTALETADGKRWQPADRVTYEHFGAAGDGTTDDTTAILAAHCYCIANGRKCEPRAATYKVTGRILYYNTDKNGSGKEFHLHGAGKGATVFKITDDIDPELFQMEGEDTVGGNRVINWSFRDFQVTSDGQVDADVFRIDIATSIEFENVGAFNCRGTVLRLREVWDSRINVSAVECGDDGGGTGPDTGNKYAVWVEPYPYAGGTPADRGCNNLDFNERFQIEASRYAQMYVGQYTKQCVFRGKWHGKVTGTLVQPHVLMESAYRNVFLGCTMTVCADTCVRTNNTPTGGNYNNVFVGNHFDSTGTSCVELNDAQRYYLVGNVFKGPNSSIYGVELKSGSSGNIIYANIADTVTEMSISSASVMADVSAQTMVPLSDATYDLGSATLDWANVYADTFTGDFLDVDTIDSGATIENTGARAQLSLNRTDVSSAQQGSIEFNENNVTLGEIEVREVGGSSQFRIRNVELDTELQLDQNGWLVFFTDFSASTSYHVALSDGTTGGSGSAGSGNQYVELNINGTTYKVLHDGTV